ncbi:hypothetical protein [Pseudomonas sp. FEN]|uniref:hypothetical protein n=1 Tax=Pseudomonas sp. FEN TaxID=2767468 RepID=UPI00174A0EAB|nr:hypothetical protein [Pseudomonas sp. FEN]CAD5201164.1 hypothetical protein [Pseudomonas sp. FEN]
MKLSPLLQSLDLTAPLTVLPTCFTSAWVITAHAHPAEVTTKPHLIYLDRPGHLEAGIDGFSQLEKSHAPATK